MARLTGWCNGCWDWIVRPDGFHAHRWRFVATWIIAFSLIVAWSLQEIRGESTKNDQRFCDITSSYIESNLALRDAQNEASVTAVGQRQTLIEATDRIIRYLKVPPGTPRTVPQREFNRALLTYLQAQNKLHQQVIDSGVETLVAAEEATLQWERLQRRLRC
jgi:hypothetical protein